MLNRRDTLAVLASGMVAGCTTATTSSGPSVTDVSLLLNWKPNGLHVPYYAAKSRGYYDEEGLNLTKIESGKGSHTRLQRMGRPTHTRPTFSPAVHRNTG